MVLGIDLGTTYSCAAFINENGEPEVVPNLLGERITPSAILMEAENKPIVGTTAKEQASYHPQNYVALMKNDMGRIGDDGKSSIVYHTDFGDLTPEIASAYVLKQLATDASKFLAGRNDNKPITDVVVTTPYYFNEVKKQATDDAIELAGLHRIYVINEPTAASLYYVNKYKLRNANILVYDLGGGTFDATVIRVDGNGNLEVKSTGGQPKCGGSFLDADIVRHIVSDFEKETGIDLYQDEYKDVLQELYINVEKKKIQLSQASSSVLMLKAGGKFKEYTLTRDELNQYVQKMWDRTRRVIDQALREANIGTEDIDKVVMVGGSSKIPFIQDSMKAYIGKELSLDVNPDEVVAMGAAIAGLIAEKKSSQTFTDICAHGIGITVYDEKLKPYNSIVIPPKSKLPAKAEKWYCLEDDSAKEIVLDINQGNFKEIEDVTPMATVSLKRPENKSGQIKMKIRFELDEYQKLHLFVEINNQESEVDIEASGVMTKAQFSEWKKKTSTAMDSIDERSGIKKFFDDVKSKFTSNESKEEKKAEAKPEVKKEKPKSDIPKVIQKIFEEEEIIGMSSVAEIMRNYLNHMNAQEKRSTTVAVEDEDTCVAILGKPHMGCTTAANVVAKCLYKFTAVPSDTVVRAGYEDFVTGQPQQDEIKKAIEGFMQQAMGGILLIDNFHEFLSDNDASPQNMAIDLLIKAYQAARSQGKIVIIISGYQREMEQIFDKKPKLYDLFDLYKIELDKPTSDEYVQILHKLAGKKGYVVDDLADETLRRHIKGEAETKDFKHINYIKDLIETAKTNNFNELSKKRHVSNEEYSILELRHFGLSEGKKTLEELLEELDGLTGLAGVKEQIRKIINQVEVNKKIKAEGAEVNTKIESQHMIFYGPPGTGKTTVARLVGEIFREMGILPRGQFVEADRAALVSQYVNDTAIKTKAKIDEAMGGILFVDEAYTLYSPNGGAGNNDGKEAIETIMKAMEDNRDKLVVILAGYENEMNDFMTANPGLETRFSQYNRVFFEDYTNEEMWDIFQGMAKGKGLEIESLAIEPIKKRIAKECKGKNGRGVRNLLQAIEANKATRIAAIDGDIASEYRIIRVEDVTGSQEAVISDNEVIANIQNKLNGWIGLNNVKREINNLIAVYNLNKARGDESSARSYHLVFAGNPGTGKTTIARMVADIYQALGIIPTNKVHEVDRASLVAGYVGQTAPKTMVEIERARGGILFIDEAYKLAEGGPEDFGKEAIDTLLKDMEDHRGDYVVIVAGYQDRMNTFVASNPGLKSRFKKTIVFDDYSAEEKWQIFLLNINKKGLEISEDCKQAFDNLIEACGDNDSFGNARGVEKIIDYAYENMAIRLATAGTGEQINTNQLLGIDIESIPISDLIM